MLTYLYYKCPFFIIGKKLGSGACGSVHELHQEGNTKYNNDWAIKLAPLPKSKAKSGKGKRKKTVEERNADLIQHENLTLQNAGSDMRGRLVPDIPFMGSPPAFGETADGGKFIFIIHEYTDQITVHSSYPKKCILQII